MLGIFWCKSQLGMASLGEARPVPVASGRARWGLVNAADGSTEGASPLCCSLWGVVMAWSAMVWSAMAGFGRVRRGPVERGLAIAADGSTELRKRLPAALLKSRQGFAWRGLAWLGLVWFTWARQGEAIAADGSTERLRALSAALYESGYGVARRDLVRQGTAGLR